MFERNRVNSVTANPKMAIPVEIQLADGRELKGKFFISSASTIRDELNGPDNFLEFEPYQGERRMMVKRQILDVKFVNAPTPRGLPSTLQEIDGFNPYAILGIERETPWGKVRAQYVALARIYHPDNYAKAKLPSEVSDYMAAMARRINAAFDAVDAPRRVVKRKSNVAKPVYTSQPRV
ncbi:MAG: J domain-containing protein [Hyphomicrobiaceae bacterium]